MKFEATAANPDAGPVVHPWWRRAPHLAAAAVAMGIGAMILALGIFAAKRLESRYIHAVAPELFGEKNKGLALQKLAFAQPDLLPFYGSSELLKPVPGKPPEFFHAHPAGFEVFEVGRSGAACLSMLQKLGGVGAGLRGKKVAISLSPTFFFEQNVPERFYAGNFSLLQAGELIYSGNLSLPLRRDIARRMLEHPETLDQAPILSFALERLAADSALDRVLFAAAVPLGSLKQSILQLQDHVHAALRIWRERTRLRAVSAAGPPQPIPWDALFAKVNAETQPQEDQDPDPSGPEAGPEAFARMEGSAGEWVDLELLLRALRELGARPLLLSMPVDGAYFDRCGVGRPYRDLYYTRLRALAEKYGMPLIEFESHDEDEAFLAGHHDHLSQKGWLYFNRALDQFFHGAPLSGVER